MAKNLYYKSDLTTLNHKTGLVQDYTTSRFFPSPNLEERAKHNLMRGTGQSGRQKVYSVEKSLEPTFSIENSQSWGKMTALIRMYDDFYIA